jgi:hypothetical protein
VAKGNFGPPKICLHADLHDLRCTFSTFGTESNVAELETVIQEEIDWCFKVHDPDKFHSWRWTDELYKFHKSANIKDLKLRMQEKKEQDDKKPKALSEVKQERLVAIPKR